MHRGLFLCLCSNALFFIDILIISLFWRLVYLQ